MTGTVRDIPGFFGYRIGDHGAVFSCRVRGGTGGLGTTWRQIKGRRGPTGYWQVTLWRDGERFHPYVHRLVLLAFSGPAPDQHQARHLNGVRDDNRIENLAWGTVSENHADKLRHGTDNRGERHNCAKLSTADVRSIRDMRSRGAKLLVIARRFAISEQHVSKICRNELWSHVKIEASNE